MGIITVSDRSYRGEREDQSGPAIREWAENSGYRIEMELLVPDEISEIRNALLECVERNCDLVMTTGGTGFAPRDVTPEATLQVVERLAPGFAEVMRQKSMEITPRAVLSRGVSGIKKGSIIINLPGSPKAVRENLSAIQKALPHAVEILRGTGTD